MSYQNLVKTRLNKVQWSAVIAMGLVAVVFLGICVYDLTKQAVIDALVMVIIAAVFAYLTVKQLPGQKFRRYCQAVARLGNADEIFARLDAMEPCAAAGSGDLRFDESYIAYVGDDTATIRLAGDLVWGHLHQSTGQRHWGVIPIGSYESYGAMLRFVDGTSVCVELPDSKTALVVLEKLKQRYPYMMLGYSGDLEALYRKDPRELWSAAGYQNERS